ncbi:hypothetical protein PV327_006718 [Microctonus hyperodae]|uniref:Uncharacterized protein n=1 Tax=Microctonus hyperodae TaxID=165561 RepID=A0AA39KIV0_MICHY|nr:hypothetical protein PV327_006718 [Microctonus hyperodae]
MSSSVTIEKYRVVVKRIHQYAIASWLLYPKSFSVFVSEISSSINEFNCPTNIPRVKLAGLEAATRVQLKTRRKVQKEKRKKNKSERRSKGVYSPGRKNYNTSTPRPGVTVHPGG